ncbi:hypothetical protein [Fibrobacter sp. UWB2]|nr:hypothetical protein [Fibrobacter sp. UWB2]
MVCFKTSLCAAFSLAVSTFAGPIMTVPWNGHPGAAKLVWT